MYAKQRYELSSFRHLNDAAATTHHSNSIKTKQSRAHVNLPQSTFMQKVDYLSHSEVLGLTNLTATNLLPWVLIDPYSGIPSASAT